MASFIITKSYIHEGAMGKPTEMSRTFPQNEKGLARLLKGEGTAFVLKDDDGMVYFRGKSLNDSSFDPMDAYGAAFGCTILEYRNADGTYSEL